MQEDKKKLFILLGGIAVVIVVIIAALQIKGTQNSAGVSNTSTKVEVATSSPEEVAPSKSATNNVATVTPEVLKESVQIASGTSLVTKDNQVVTAVGAPVKLNVMPSSVEAPKESAPIKGNSVVASANNIKISVSAAGFVPNTFKVKEGQLVNFVLTSTDSYTHVWLPDDMSLVATALGVAGNETRVKSWNAPKKGTYTFHCDIPGHADRGEKGTMIVE